MNVLICLLVVTSVVTGKFLKPSRVLINIEENHGKIQKIFEKISTLSVLLRNYEQPDGITQLLQNIFGAENQTQSIFNFLNEESFEEWVVHCKDYRNDTSRRTAYYERLYQKTHKESLQKQTLDFFDDTDLFGDDMIDPQSPFATSVSVQIQERFADSLDKWFAFRASGFILFCSLNIFEHFLGCLTNRVGTFLYIIEEDFCSDSYFQDIKKVLEISWKHSGNLDLYILFCNEIYHLNPYAWDATVKSFGVMQKFNVNESTQRFTNLNGYPINIEIFHSAYSISYGEEFTGKLGSFYGPDVQVAQFIQEQMNVTMNLVKNVGKFGGKLANGTLTGSLGNLQKRRTEVAFTAFFVKDYETRACEFTQPLYMDELCAVVKKAPRIPSELLPLMIFSESLWICLFCSGVSIFIFWSFIRAMNNFNKRPSRVIDKVQFYIDSYNFSNYMAHQSVYRQYCQMFVDTWMIFLSVPMRRFTKAPIERLFISTVALVGMIIISMYQSGLSTVFVRPLYFKDISTLEQLDKAGFLIEVKYSGYLTDVFPNDSTQTYRHLREKMRLVETKEYAMELVRDHDKVATITRKSTTQLDNSIYFIRKQLHLIEKECPKNYFLAYMVPSGSIYLNRINEILFDIHRFGFIKKWIDEINFSEVLRNMKSFHDNSSITKVLSMDDLKFPYFLLASGSVLSLSIAIIEIVLHFVNGRKKFGKIFRSIQ